MSRYARLSQHLRSAGSGEWKAEFKEIEAILGASLPESARKYPAWWSNQKAAGHSQSDAWKSVGWRTSDLDLGSERITFVRDFQQIDKSKTRENEASPVSIRPDLLTEKRKLGGITIAEAKSGLAAYFGVSPDSIEITIKG